MKTQYVSSLLFRKDAGSAVSLNGWVKAKRDHGNVVFVDVCDSTGFIQAVFERTALEPAQFVTAKSVATESAVNITGVLVNTGRPKPYFREVKASGISVIGPAILPMDPQPRAEIDILDPALQPQLMHNRHFYIRNPKLMEIMWFRHFLLDAVRWWFNRNRFIEITAPVLTPTPLYDDSSALSLEIGDQKVFLTQCVGFYLEAAVHAFERVYNIGPSFRGEESRSKRHLMEYWHIKAELAFGNREDIIGLVEKMVSTIAQKCQIDARVSCRGLDVDNCSDALEIPYPRISYPDAVIMLQKRGYDFEFGKGLGSEEEAVLSESFDRPFWVVGIPRSIEPFPYVVDPDDTRLTMTADLIATRGYGELLGVAEKIHDPAMLDERMEEKGKLGHPEYEWLRDMRRFGCVPHIGFGMGVERLIRWMLNIPHVRDTIPFFRTFGRQINP